MKSTAASASAAATPPAKAAHAAHGFRKLRSHNIPALKLCMEEYRHASGTPHFHLAAERDENVFMVALRTMPEDSRGVAHVLEHTALCGSRRYPVRDPFFLMLRRSLNTFMNAFTSSDWTAYPFASRNYKDFQNLLDVYLDAVFFPQLDALDFAQEGHRLEFSPAQDARGEQQLQHKGVVYNEMKGVVSSPLSVLRDTLDRHLYPTTTYHHNSGGDPESIRDLRHEHLLAFHRRHYHPSNAIFLTYGNIPAAQHQAKFSAQVLRHFDDSAPRIAVPEEKRYYAPLQVEDSYALSDSSEAHDKTHIVLAWLLGKHTDSSALLEADLLDSVLLGDSAAPLRQALETSTLGQRPSPLCGLDSEPHEMNFCCGLEGSNPEQAAALEKLVLDTLQRVEREGVTQKRLHALIDQLELAQREISGDSYPYGLSLLLRSLPALIHRADPLPLLDLEPLLKELRAKSKRKDFIPGLVRRLLLDNPHRLRLVLKPDTHLAQRRQEAEQKQLAQIQRDMDETQKQRIAEQAVQLQQRQQQEQDSSLLPKVGLKEVDADQILAVQGHDTRVGTLPLRLYGQGTNGLVYQDILAPLPQLDSAEQGLLSIYAACMSELGVGERSYLQTQTWQTEVCGALSGHGAIGAYAGDEQQVSAHMVLTAKALGARHTALCGLMRDTIEALRFDEYARLKELLADMRGRMENGVTQRGHMLAVGTAAKQLSPVALLRYRLHGADGIRAMIALHKSLDDTVLEQLAARLAALHHKLWAQPRRLLCIGEEEQRKTLHAGLEKSWSEAAAAARSADAGGDTLRLPATRAAHHMIWHLDSQVNFCAEVFPTVPMTHEDAAPLRVLGTFLHNGQLHRAIREEGGAYGAGATQDSEVAAFCFYSYRDPQLQKSFDAFAAAVRWAVEGQHSAQSLEEAILGVISRMDKPKSPAGEAKSCYYMELCGKDVALRRRFRRQVLEVRLEDLQRVAAHYLAPEQASRAVLTDHGQVSALMRDPRFQKAQAQPLL